MQSLVKWIKNLLAWRERILNANKSGESGERKAALMSKWEEMGI